MLYNCNICGKQFNQKGHYTNHLNRINPCIKLTKKIPQIPSWSNIIQNFNQQGDRDYDQNFLRDYIYPIIINNSTIHATFNKMEPHAKNFPINYCNNLRFVGEYIYYDESRSIEHINILRKYLMTNKFS